MVALISYTFKQLQGAWENYYDCSKCDTLLYQPLKILTGSLYPDTTCQVQDEKVHEKS